MMHKAQVHVFSDYDLCLRLNAQTDASGNWKITYERSSLVREQEDLAQDKWTDNT